MSLCEEGWVYECPLCGVKGRLEDYHDPETGLASSEGEDLEDLDDDPPTMCFSCGGIFGFFQLIEHPA